MRASRALRAEACRLGPHHNWGLPGWQSRKVHSPSPAHKGWKPLTRLNSKEKKNITKPTTTRRTRTTRTTTSSRVVWRCAVIKQSKHQTGMLLLAVPPCRGRSWMCLCVCVCVCSNGGVCVHTSGYQRAAFPLCHCLCLSFSSTLCCCVKNSICIQSRALTTTATTNTIKIKVFFFL